MRRMKTLRTLAFLLLLSLPFTLCAQVRPPTRAEFKASIQSVIQQSSNWMATIDLVKSEDLDVKSTIGQEFEKAKDNARAGIARLVANQKTDGGFSLWPGESRSSVPVTAIASRVLEYADQLKVDGAGRAFHRARRWLGEAIRDEGAIPNSQLGAFELALLNDIGMPGDVQQRSLEFVKQVLDTENASLGELLAALDILNRRAGQYWFDSQLDEVMGRPAHETARAELAARLTDRVRKLETGPYLAQVRADFAEIGFSYGEPALIASVLGVLRGTETMDDRLRVDLTHRLLERLERGWWHSTMETAQILFDVRQLLADEAEAAKREAASGVRHVIVKIGDGRKALELTPIPGGFVGNFAVDAPSGDFAHVDITGMRRDEVASGVIRASVAFGAVRALPGGLAVERTLYRVGPSGASELSTGGELSRGDVIVSEVAVQRPVDKGIQGAAGANPSDFVVVEDGLPSLAEGIEADRTILADAKLQPDDDSFWVRVKQTLRYPDRTTRVVALVPGATITVHQAWRVAFAGKASVPPARAFDMYDDTIAGNTAAAEIVAH